MGVHPSQDYFVDPKLTVSEHLTAPHRIAYVEQMSVYVHDLRSRRRQKVFGEGAWHTVCPLVWSPDGNTLFHSHDQLVAIDVRTRRAKRLTSLCSGGQSKIPWVLECSPDGRTLFFLHHPSPPKRPQICSVGADGQRFRVVTDVERVYRFACSWQLNAIFASVYRDKHLELMRIDMDSGEATPFLDVPAHDLRVAGDGERAVYSMQSAIWLLDLRTGKRERVVEHGSSPALSPNGTTIAFRRGDAELHVRRIGSSKERCLLRPRKEQHRWRGGSYQVAPAWSVDGRCLWFASTTGERFDDPPNPEFVATMRRRQAAARRRGGKARIDYAGSIEHAHWAFRHVYGVIDLIEEKIWIAKGYWQDVAWAPTLTIAKRDS